MATVKLNTCGSSKSMEVYLRFGKQCFDCEKPLTFKQFQLEHIHPREHAKTYKGKNINEPANLCCLCKNCNSKKYLTPAKEYYTQEKFAKLMTLASFTLDKQLVLSAGDAYAKENPTGKFAKLHRAGLYWQPAY